MSLNYCPDPGTPYSSSLFFPSVKLVFYLLETISLTLFGCFNNLPILHLPYYSHFSTPYQHGFRGEEEYLDSTVSPSIVPIPRINYVLIGVIQTIISESLRPTLEFSKSLRIYIGLGVKESPSITRPFTSNKCLPTRFSL